MNWVAIVSGLGVIALGEFLRYTRFGQPGPPILEEEFTRRPSGAMTNYRLRLKLASPETLFRVIGVALALYGVLWPLNWIMIASGIAITLLGQYVADRKRFGTGLARFREPLWPAYETFRFIGDEVRSEKGYIVRRIEKGLQYAEGNHSLTLRGSRQQWAIVEEERSRQPDGTFASRKTLTIHTPHFKLRWDPPYENENIPRERLFEIVQRISEALNSKTVVHANR
jgi:hypothetical protein